MSNLKQVIEARKNKKNPQPVEWQNLATEIAQKVVADYMKDVEKDIVAQVQEKIKQVVDQRVAENLRGKDGMPGRHGRDGRDGITPSKSELLAVIKPLIPKVKDGKSPTDSQLLRLIYPLIPQVSNGKDGSPDTPKQVVDKVNSMGGLRLDAIEGLIEKLEEVKKQSRSKSGGKGSGMGNTQHETKSISAGTTSVTTTYPIAGNGNAIFKSAYQGQVLDKDVHFTVGADNKTINFDSATSDQFVNSTTFSITYIRG